MSQPFLAEIRIFTGNFAPAISIDATDCESDEPDVLVRARWTRILPSTSLSGNSHHLVEIQSSDTWSHLRINIYPDGGIARLVAEPAATSFVAVEPVAQPECDRLGT